MKKSNDWSISDLVVYKNNQLLALNKPAGLAVQMDKTGDKALLNLAEIYTKGNVLLTHRIDRPASGLVLFAKTKGALAKINAQFQDRSIKKIYLAVVAELPNGAAKGELSHFLKKNGKTNKSYVVENATPGAKEARLSYELLEQIDNYYLLKVELFTGRHHQIRAQMSAAKAPIKGDVKYGFRRNNPDRSIHLHAWELHFNHPVSGDRVKLQAPVPKEAVWDAFKTLQHG
ncbi:MAG: RluA family pseudouridine synthase [Bacteroidota bacterium]